MQDRILTPSHKKNFEKVRDNIKLESALNLLNVIIKIYRNYFLRVMSTIVISRRI